MYHSQLSRPWRDPLVIDLTGDDDCEKSTQQYPITAPQTAHVISENPGRVGQRFNIAEGFRGIAARGAARHNGIAASTPHLNSNSFAKQSWSPSQHHGQQPLIGVGYGGVPYAADRQSEDIKVPFLVNNSAEQGYQAYVSSPPRTAYDQVYSVLSPIAQPAVAPQGHYVHAPFASCYHEQTPAMLPAPSYQGHYTRAPSAKYAISHHGNYVPAQVVHNGLPRLSPEAPQNGDLYGAVHPNERTPLNLLLQPFTPPAQCTGASSSASPGNDKGPGNDAASPTLVAQDPQLIDEDYLESRYERDTVSTDSLFARNISMRILPTTPEPDQDLNCNVHGLASPENAQSAPGGPSLSNVDRLGSSLITMGATSIDENGQIIPDYGYVRRLVTSINPDFMRQYDERTRNENHNGQSSSSVYSSHAANSQVNSVQDENRVHDHDSQAPCSRASDSQGSASQIPHFKTSSLRGPRSQSRDAQTFYTQSSSQSSLRSSHEETPDSTHPVSPPQHDGSSPPWDPNFRDLTDPDEAFLAHCEQSYRESDANSVLENTESPEPQFAYSLKRAHSPSDPHRHAEHSLYPDPLRIKKENIIPFTMNVPIHDIPSHQTAIHEDTNGATSRAASFVDINSNASNNGSKSSHRGMTSSNSNGKSPDIYIFEGSSDSDESNNRSARRSKDLFGQNGLLGREDETRRSSKRARRAGGASDNRLISKLNNMRARFSPIPPCIVTETTASISFGSHIQSQVYARLDELITGAANGFLMAEYYEGNLTAASIQQVRKSWGKKNTHGVPQFRFDQQTQCKLVSANRENVRFGKTARTPHAKSILADWERMGKDMGARTLVAPDGVIKKHLCDAVAVLEILKAPSTFIQEVKEILERVADDMAKLKN